VPTDEDAADEDAADEDRAAKEEALALLEHVEPAFAALDMPVQRASALQAIGTLRRDPAVLRRTAELLRGTGDRGATATALRGLGLLLSSQGRLEQAEAVFLEAAGLRRTEAEAELSEGTWRERSSTEDHGRAEAEALLDAARVRLERGGGKDLRPALAALEGALAALGARAKQTLDAFNLQARIEQLQEGLLERQREMEGGAHRADAKEKDKDV
jgi:hypothetical protein